EVKKLEGSLAAANIKLEDQQRMVAAGIGGDAYRQNIKQTEAEIADLTAKLEVAQGKARGLTLEMNRKPGPFVTTTTPHDPLQDFDEIKFVKKDLDAVIERLNGMPVLFANAFTFDTSGFEGAMAKVDNAV